MKRNTLNFVIDGLTLLVLMGVAWTGLLLEFVLPPGSRGRTLLGSTRHDWGDWHFYLTIALGLLLLVHVALHWQWVCVTVCRVTPGLRGKSAKMTPARRTAAGAVFLAALVAISVGSVLAGRALVEPGAGPGGGGGQRHGQVGSAESAPDPLKPNDSAADDDDGSGEQRRRRRGR